ncbi:MAG: deoxyribose-phosphate aldolase [Bacteroidetes bacterium]|jgi:deoxyribose-phosphate aldolase|nr:deoxyribose-phosphate aldolase [Bacteroidota bacterium]MDF1863769.1 deoxyribose-phosphate aldolase [Saprospiraceae bacterium]
MNLTKFIDHTILKPNCTKADIERICEEADLYQFPTVCIPPFFVKDAANILEDKLVKVGTVIGFPMGYSTTAAKVEEIKRSINDGADEVDVVVNVCAIKSEQWNYVRNDIDSATRAVHLKGKVIKIILETCLLTASEIKRVCDFCTEIGVDYVKTSTGFNGEGATNETVAYLKSLLPSNIKIKASGGIKSQNQAIELIEAGANRLGCSSSLQIVEGH